MEQYMSWNESERSSRNDGGWVTSRIGCRIDPNGRRLRYREIPLAVLGRDLRRRLGQETSVGGPTKAVL
jgi:hypothetical protein